MFDHVGYPVRDLAVSLEFYTRALKPLGLKLLMTIDLSDETGRAATPDLASNGRNFSSARENR